MLVKVIAVANQQIMHAVDKIHVKDKDLFPCPRANVNK
jgi:hypothetical protein